MDTNPDRMPRRHRWMVNEVGRIEFLFCPREAVEVDLRDFEKIPLDTDAIWRAGRRSANIAAKISDDPVLPDFSIRAGGGAESSAPDQRPSLDKILSRRGF